MVKDKIYFPISEDYEDFIAITNSKDGLILPIFYNNEKKFHITAYIKKYKKDYVFDIHLTNQKVDKHYPVLRSIITQKQFENFGKRCDELT